MRGRDVRNSDKIQNAYKISSSVTRFSTRTSFVVFAYSKYPSRIFRHAAMKMAIEQVVRLGRVSKWLVAKNFGNGKTRKKEGALVDQTAR